jgi:hypothetical protein
MKENLTKAFLAFYYFCLLIYVPTESHPGENIIWTSGWNLFFDINAGTIWSHHHVDLDRLVLQLLAGTLVLVCFHFVIKGLSTLRSNPNHDGD